MPEAVIVEAVRTPFGRRGGALREQRPDSLLAHALNGLVQRAGVPPEKIEDVIDGTVTLAGEQGANPARLAVLLADFPVQVPGVSLNRMCGSSQQALHFAAQAVAAGDMNYVIASGVESMTRARKRAFALTPSSFATSAFATSTAEAPSEIWLEFAAVITPRPSGRNAGLRLAIFCSSIIARTPSSWVRVIFCASGPTPSTGRSSRFAPAC